MNICYNLYYYIMALRELLSGHMIILSRSHFAYSVYWSDYRRSIKAFIFIVVVISIIPSCKETSMELYTSNQITLIGIKAINAENVEIKYVPMLETLYFCPGAKITENEDAILINFMRCPIKETCKVTHVARLDAIGNYAIVIKHKGKPLFINFEMGKQKIYPK